MDEKNVIKKRGNNSPVIGNNGITTESGDNTKYIAVSMELTDLPAIDLHDPKQVEDRLHDYFNIHMRYDMKPTVAGMAMALGNGTTRQTLWAIKNDQPSGGSGYKTALPSEVADSIKKAYLLLENLWENYAQNGKMNPVTSIFLGKNNFGYSDKQEYVLTPNQQNDNEYDADSIRERYIAADQQKKLTDGGNDED